MKIQLRSVLFALALPLAACGGDHDSTTVEHQPVAFHPMDYVRMPSAPQQVDVVAASPEQLKVVDATLPMPTKYDELLVLGKQLVEQGKHADAKEMFDAAIKLERKKAEPHIELARMYITMKEKGLAVASANKAVKLAPQSSQAWNTKGRAELNAHKYEEAIAAFTTAVELNADNVFAWNNLGYTELQLKRYDDAVAHLTEATERTGATGYMFNNLGTALEHLDRLDEARLAYESGGKLGSSEAGASRKRLEGVDSIAVAVIGSEVHDEPEIVTSPKVKEYTNVEESEVEEPTVVKEIDEGDVEDEETL
jgi:tetratricopeptide (TPR) repeat protein